MDGRGGQFVWHNLVSAEPEASVAFYAELFGWQFQPVDGSYRVIVAGGVPIGGVVTLPPPSRVPAYWLGDIEVADLDTAVAAARRLGGRLEVPPTIVPSVCRFAVLVDPAGASIAALEYTTAPPAAPASGAPGVFCWDELLTRDPAAAVPFYSEVFGWSFAAASAASAGGQLYAAVRARRVAAIVKCPPGAEHRPFWNVYVRVADLDREVARASRLDARVWVPPGDLPGVGRYALLGDPTGAFFSLFEPLGGPAA